MPEIKTTIEAGGAIIWWQDGVQHREDGPAYAERDYTAWYKLGARHRADGPARIWGQRNKKEWWFEGKLHRYDGPAYEEDNRIIFYLFGNRITIEEDIDMLKSNITDSEKTILALKYK